MRRNPTRRETCYWFGYVSLEFPRLNMENLPEPPQPVKSQASESVE